MFLVLCLISALMYCANANNVPVLMWSPSRPLSDLPQPFVGNTIDRATFQKSYLSPLSTTNGHHIVVFLQDKLNINDFAKYADIYNPYSDGGAFKNIKALMEENFSVHLPGVKTPTSAINELKESFKGRQHLVTAAADIPNLKLDDGKNYLIMVVLPRANSGNNEEKSFTNNDAVVNDVVKELKKRSLKYTALYTAESSQQKSESAYTGRRLLAEAVERNDSIFINKTEMYLYARKITFCIIDPVTKTNFNLTMPYDIGQMDDTASTIDNKTGLFEVTFIDVMQENGTIKYNFTFRFELTKTLEERMKIANFSVMLKNGSDIQEEMMDIKNLDLDLPAIFSYHCSDFNIIQRNRTEKKPYFKISFSGFQFQAFTIQNDEFGQPWDCVPFFTTPIWMALFYGAIFVFILYYGMYMMFNLSTMDRFDDPKGKTITVNASD